MISTFWKKEYFPENAADAICIKKLIHNSLIWYADNYFNVQKSFPHQIVDNVESLLTLLTVCLRNSS